MPMTVEETMNDIIASAKAGRITNHITDDTHKEWTIQGTENSFRIVIANRTSTTNREFNKNNIYRIAEDGTERILNLGEWKKKKFYTLVYALEDGKVFTKIKPNPEFVKQIADHIKHNPANWNRTNDEIVGTIEGNSYRIIRERKTFDSGKILCRCKCYKNGELTDIKGSQLMKLWR